MNAHSLVILAGLLVTLSPASPSTLHARRRFASRGAGRLADNQAQLSGARDGSGSPASTGTGSAGAGAPDLAGRAHRASDPSCNRGGWRPLSNGVSGGRARCAPFSSATHQRAHLLQDERPSGSKAWSSNYWLTRLKHAANIRRSSAGQKLVMPPDQGVSPVHRVLSATAFALVFFTSFALSLRPAAALASAIAPGDRVRIKYDPKQTMVLGRSSLSMARASWSIRTARPTTPPSQPAPCTVSSVSRANTAHGPREC